MTLRPIVPLRRMVRRVPRTLIATNNTDAILWFDETCHWFAHLCICRQLCSTRTPTAPASLR